jgi:hypothetical protein
MDLASCVACRWLVTGVHPWLDVFVLSAHDGFYDYTHYICIHLFTCAWLFLSGVDLCCVMDIGSSVAGCWLVTSEHPWLQVG